LAQPQNKQGLQYIRYHQKKFYLHGPHKFYFAIQIHGSPTLKSMQILFGALIRKEMIAEIEKVQ